METVLLTALGVGGSTVIGALLGFILKKIPHKWNDAILSFAAGVMFAAATVGLILPAVDQTGIRGIWQVVLGILVGAVFLNLMDLLVPHLHKLSGLQEEEHRNNQNINHVFLFVLAIAIHNLPEGMAAGVSFGGENTGHALSVAFGIMLQNVPEGMVLISPMLLAGVSRTRTFLIALTTSLIEVAGTFIGYAAGTASELLLPFALSFAGGAMLYVICDEMIPDTHAHGYERLATYSLILGFILMIVLQAAVA